MRPGTLVLVLLLSPFGALPLGAGSPGAGSVVLGLGAGGETRDVLGVGDIRPISRGTLVTSARLELALTESWRAGIAGQIGASWFDFRQPLGVSNGNIKDQSWLIRGRLDRRMSTGGDAVLYLGLGAEYGEARSWTDTRFYSERGPRAFHGGGSLRFGLAQPLGRRFEIYAEVEQSVFHAHARSGTTQGDYNWIGSATSIVVGLNTTLRLRPQE